MPTLLKWLAALVGGVILLLLVAFSRVALQNSFAPTSAQERSALFRDLRAASRRDMRTPQDLSAVAGRQLPPGLPAHLAQAALSGAGFACNTGVPQHCDLLLDRSLIGRTHVHLVVWYVNDEVRTVQAQLQGVYL